MHDTIPISLIAHRSNKAIRAVGTLPQVLAEAASSATSKYDLPMVFLHALPNGSNRPLHDSHGGLTGFTSVDLDQEPPMGWSRAWDTLSRYEDLTLLETASGKIALAAVVPNPPVVPQVFNALAEAIARRVASRVETVPDVSAKDIARGRFVWKDMRVQYGTKFFADHDVQGEGYPDSAWMAWTYGRLGLPREDLDYLIRRRTTAEVLNSEYSKGAEKSSAKGMDMAQLLLTAEEMGIFVYQQEYELKMVHDGNHHTGFYSISRALTSLLHQPIGLGAATESALLVASPTYSMSEALDDALAAPPDSTYKALLQPICEAWELDESSVGALARGIQSLVIHMVTQVPQQEVLVLFGGAGMGKSALFREMLYWTLGGLRAPVVPASTTAINPDALDAVQAGADIIILDELNRTAIGDDLLKAFISDTRAVRRKYDRAMTRLEPVPTVITTNLGSNIMFTNGVPDRRQCLVHIRHGLDPDTAEARGRVVREYVRSNGRDIMAAALHAPRVPRVEYDPEYWNTTAGEGTSMETLAQIYEMYGPIISISQHINSDYGMWGFDKPARMKAYLVGHGLVRVQVERREALAFPADVVSRLEGQSA